MDTRDFKTISDEVDSVIAGWLDEITKAVTTLGNSEVFIRTRLLIAFALLEVLCGVFDKYHDLNLTNRPLLKRWLREYCLTPKNQAYANHPYLKRIDDERLYKFRNSIMHAFAIPESEGGVAVIVVNGSELDSKLQKMDAALSRKGITAIFISPDSLTGLFAAGAKILMSEMFVSVDAATPQHLEGMSRVRREFFRRGSKKMSLTQ